MENKKPKTDGSSNNSNDDFPTDNGSMNPDGEMPSVTRLLNRKSLGLSSQPPSTPPKKPPTSLTPPQKQPKHEEAKPTFSLKLDLPNSPTIEPPSAIRTVSPPAETPTENSSSQLEISLSDSSDGTASSNELVLESLSGTTTTPQAVTYPTPQSIPLTDTGKSPSPATGPKIQVQVKKAVRPAAVKLAVWPVEALDSAKDPMTKGLAQLFRQGAESALILSITNIPGKTTPQFLSSAVLLPKEKLGIWTGLKWDTGLTPETWNAVAQNSFTVLSPLKAAASSPSTPGTPQNPLRAALGVSQEEWVSILCIGPRTACRGILVVISCKDITAEIKAALPQITSPLPK